MSRVIESRLFPNYYFTAEEKKNMDKRKVETSQEEYCRGCILVPGCNVILKDGESCGDRQISAFRDAYEKSLASSIVKSNLKEERIK